MKQQAKKFDQKQFFNDVMAENRAIDERVKLRTLKNRNKVIRRRPSDSPTAHGPLGGK